MDGVTCMTPIGQTKEVFDGFNLFEDEKSNANYVKFKIGVLRKVLHTYHYGGNMMSSNMMVGMAFEDTFAYKLIYIMSIDDSQHKGLLKIGEATIKTNSEIDEIKPCCHELNIAAKQRIDSYTKTAAISYNLLYTELAVRKEKTDSGSEVIKSFSDHKVHDVLTNSGFERKEFDDARGKEWFVVDLITARSAIAAVKENRTSISQVKLASKYAPIIFRPEQEAAIEQTIKIFKDRNRMLWNAKMRFGKTLCALEVIKKLQLKKVLLLHTGR